MTLMEMVAGSTVSLKVARTVDPLATPVAPSAGSRPLTVGGVVSGVPEVGVKTTSTQ